MYRYIFIIFVSIIFQNHIQAEEESTKTIFLEDNNAVLYSSLTGKRKRDDKENINPLAVDQDGDVHFEEADENSQDDSQKRIKKTPIHNYQYEVVKILERHNLDPNIVWLFNMILKSVNMDMLRELFRKAESVGISKDEIDSFIKYLNAIFSGQNILNPNCKKDNTFYKQVLVYLSKRNQNMDAVLGKLHQNNLDIIDLEQGSFCFLEEERIETEQERQLRKERERREFAQLLAASNISLESVSDIIYSENKVWKPFFKYFEQRKQNIVQNRDAKIRRDEIESAFDSLLGPSYIKITLGKNTLYFQPKFIQIDLKDAQGRTNLELMQQGLAPIGVDGRPMNIHHITRHQPGYFVLITDSFHKIESQVLHFLEKQYYIQPKEINRNEFSQLKKDIFFPAIAEYYRKIFHLE